MSKIDNNCNFFAKKNNSSINKYTECLSKYSENFNREISLDTTTPIFLDTNVLLRYYSISFAAREKLYKFIEENKNRIVLSNQIQYEFIKNREEIIQKFFEQVTNRIPKDFKSDIVNKLKAFLDNHKIVLKDYPFVETGIRKHETELEKLLVKLNETSEEKRKEHVNLIVKDKFLDLLNNCQIFDSLTEEEIQIAKNGFDLLRKNIKIENVDSKLEKTNQVFPGLGDIKEKPDDPYGDYIIYHEIMKYMLINDVDVIFMTFDNTKGDWMTKSKSPHIHYIQNMYANTNHILYILDADRSIGETLNIDVESLVKNENSNFEITIENLSNLIKSHSIFTGFLESKLDNDIINELDLAGYKAIKEVEDDLTAVEDAFKAYVKASGRRYQTVGVLRIALRIINPNFIYSYSRGKSSILSDTILEQFTKYRKYISN